MRVLITHTIPKIAAERLSERDVEVVVLTGNTKKRHILRALRKTPFDGMISLLTDTIDSEVFEVAGERLQIIANYAVGYNNIDLQEAKRRGVILTNTPDILTDTVAEHTVALILAVATRVREADRFVRCGKFTGWEPELFLGMDLKGKMLGVLGAGRIGSRVAELCHAFGMHIGYYDTTTNEALEKQTGAKRYTVPERLLEESDVVTVHMPLNDLTYHFLDARRLSLMKRTAILVNTSRGAVINEKDLITSLKKKAIFGAGLDVFENEPEVPRALRHLESVVLTPHTASASIETRDAMAILAVDNVLAVLHGGAPLTPVVK